MKKIEILIALQFVFWLTVSLSISNQNPGVTLKITEKSLNNFLWKDVLSPIQKELTGKDFGYFSGKASGVKYEFKHLTLDHLYFNKDLSKFTFHDDNKINLSIQIDNPFASFWYSWRWHFIHDSRGGNFQFNSIDITMNLTVYGTKDGRIQFKVEDVVTDYHSLKIYLGSSLGQKIVTKILTHLAKKRAQEMVVEISDMIKNKLEGYNADIQVDSLIHELGVIVNYKLVSEPKISTNNNRALSLDVNGDFYRDGGQAKMLNPCYRFEEYKHSTASQLYVSKDSLISFLEALGGKEQKMIEKRRFLNRFDEKDGKDGKEGIDIKVLVSLILEILKEKQFSLQKLLKLLTGIDVQEFKIEFFSNYIVILLNP